MPLYKRKPFTLLETPSDLKPQELVFQVRFTKEIFRDYGEYLKRLNLYRQRIWTCKVTAKTNLTYEEALVSERRATEKALQFPTELVVPVLRDVQFSMLTLKDLVDGIVAKSQEPLSEGIELQARKNSRVYACKIVKVLEEEADKNQYEIAWLDKDKEIKSTAVVNEEDLVRKKLPFTREILKSFIRESTYRSIPWVLHEKLARKHGISTDPPEELKNKFLFQNGLVVSCRKRRKNEEADEEYGERKRKKPGKSSEDESEEEPVKYPIDDLLVKPAADDPVFNERPSPSRDFSVPMNSVGDILMVWDFCTSFSRFLHLSPFPLEDFENALCHKDGNVSLIMETHSALLRVLIKDDGDYSLALQKKKRKSKISLVTWTEFLCDFIEIVDIAALSSHISTIKRGHYGLLDIQAKLGIYKELVAQVLSTDLVREKLDECIEQRRALAATKRGEALEEGRKKREKKERTKAGCDGNEGIERRSVESTGSNSNEAVKSNGAEKNKKRVISPQKHDPGNSKSKQGDITPKKHVKKLKMEEEVAAESIKESTKKRHQKLVMDNGEEEKEKVDKEQRKEYLEREIEKRFVRTNSLGKDRNYNRYWFFRRDGRIFVESSDSMEWGYYSTIDELDALIGSLNRKGERERALKNQLEKNYNRICLELQKRSKEMTPDIASGGGGGGGGEESVVRRSTRVRAPPRNNPALAFLKYVNKWKED